MCHNHSAAPEPPDDVAVRDCLTSGTDPVLYLRFTGAAGTGGGVIVLLTDIFGVNPFYRYLSALLTAEGYEVVMPDMFHRVGAAEPGRDGALARRGLLDDKLAVDDVERVIEHTTDSKRPFGVLGFCLGGSFALLTAATHDNQATATYYAFPKGAPGAKVAVTEPLQVAGSIAGPVLGHWGRQDYIDAGEVDLLATTLDSAPGETEVRWYDEAGHSFLAGLTEPGHPAARSAADSWQRTLRFFSTRLNPVPAA
ncbi:dienelactone hydrolase family protein [Amycolatopsis sp. NPDC005232]|uniref:dienelactone hydrolase family protein n=1 Tax=Amycolatopsis sp. NPDC005232 TaxID=3157027 RepID=UPI0033B61598